MSSVIVWAGRAALLAVFAVAFAGAINPRHNAAANVPPPDVIEHVAFGYLLTLFSIVSLPRVSPWWIGGFFLALATGFEIAQVFGLVSGTFQWKDIAANAGGVLAALAPLALGRFRRR
ncbi:hypothetical protein [Phenylobacterium sp. SCN 70-31]|uniref:hypothetical protein n=1 Tax=Phenylobacterium sp. SCN 70-31 TaxID=1660129 RepID=UPI000868C80D|nr:hypothetical protein [Phenylobacterium sp. SCN 70-31]ODT87957.1 MAG: hypothetical protein ABS78_08610 [Phenylobacterium sp. SCN 70-31]